MDRNTVRDIIRGHLTEYVEQIAEKSKGKNKYNCPLPACHSGTGKNKTGAFTIDHKDPEKWHCFSCGKGGDIFDLIGIIENLSDYNSQFERACNMFGINSDTPIPPKQPKPVQKQRSIEIPKDYSAYLKEAATHIADTDYWSKRGLSLETVKRFGIGYDAEWKHPEYPDKYPSARIIIPMASGGYAARAVDPNIEPRYKNAGDVGLFDASMYADDGESLVSGRLYVVEGAFDAMSIAEVGGDAVALNSTSNWRLFVKELCEDGYFYEVYKKKTPIILALDDDLTGQNTTEFLKTELLKMGMNVICYSPSGEFKDPNEALLNSRENFKNAVWFGIRASNDDLARFEEQRIYKRQSSAYHIQTLIDEIEYNRTNPPVSTGFKSLDNVLSGGLREGLYAFGAMSALGKTTFIMQMADQIAQGGRDVIIFALEMGRTELMAKSISRHTMQHIIKNGGDVRNAKTTTDITDGSRYDKYTPEEKQLISYAISEYAEYAEHIYIHQGVGEFDAAKVRELVDKHINITGTKPVVIVDYLQILAPYDVHATDKRNIDKAVLELKRLSRDFKLPVVCISSFSRANYRVAASMESFKESGGIEYTSDVVLGLQYEGIGTDGFNAKEAEEAIPKKLEIVALKVRNGRPASVPLDFYGAHNLYIERESEYKSAK